MLAVISMYSDWVAPLGTSSSVTGLTDVQIMMNLVKNVEVNIEFTITVPSVIFFFVLYTF